VNAYGVKVGWFGSFHSWINVWVAGKTDLSLTCVIPEHIIDVVYDDALYKSTVDCGDR